MGKSNITEHPSTLIRREIEEMKKQIDNLQRKLDTTERVVVEMVHKHNAMNQQLINLINLLSQNEKSKKKPAKTRK